jgi:hypothetical protein
MDLPGLRLLQTEAGGQALAEAARLAPRETDFLTCFQALSRRFPPELARPALETAILRREAAAKFPFADRLFFTRPALEQASSFPVAAYRAGRFAGWSRLVDLGCSIGADSLALAAVAPTLGLDLDPLRLALARANLAALGLAEQAAVLQADLRQGLPLRPAPGLGLFFDPARRTAERRVFSVDDYQPPLGLVQAWLADFPALAVKLSPGVKLEEIAAYPAEVEFISLHGELKEAVLWFGPLRRGAFRATLLPGGHTLTADPAAGLSLSEPQAVLYEPDPAVLRAGLVRTLAARLGASQLDPEIAYLTAPAQTPTPFARLWQVEAWFPFQLKRLRAYLRQRRVGQVTVKKRGSPLQPEALIRDLRLEGEASRVVVLTHLRGRPIVIICLPEFERLNP